jgi:hypothetical protein
MVMVVADPPAGFLRVLCFLLIFWEPVAFAAAAAGAFNAVAVRGVAVVLVLFARLVTTALCIAAGRALQDGRPAGVTLCRTALISAAVVQVFAIVTPYFPSNRLPGETPVYVAAIATYYLGWLAYTWRSKRVAAIASG